MARGYGCRVAMKTQPVKGWFPGKDSNLRSRIQSPLPYRLATREHINSSVRSGVVPPPAVTSNRARTLGLEMRIWLLAAVLLVAAGCGAYQFPGEAQSPSPGW